MGFGGVWTGDAHRRRLPVRGDAANLHDAAAADPALPHRLLRVRETT